MSCPTCLNLLRFPVNLGCGHSMCKVCILSGDEAEKARYLRGQDATSAASSATGGSNASRHGGGDRMPHDKNAVQITCRICHATSTFTSEAALVVDTELQAMVDVLQGTSAAAEACMRCTVAEATTSCLECHAKMCNGCCDLVHVGGLRSHQIVAHSSGSMDPSLQPKPCEQSGHGHYRKELYCVDCGTFLCVLCAQQLPTHKTHNVVTAADAAAVERKRLLECVHAAEVFRGELRTTVGQIDAVADATLHHAAEEIEVFEETMNALIAMVTRKRDELVGQAKALCDAEVGGLRDSRDRIFALATKLNESVAESNKALRHRSAVGIVTRAREMEDTIKRWDPIVVPSASCPAFSFPNYKDVVGMLGRVAVQPAAITSIEAGLDANHLGRTLQFMNERGVGNNALSAHNATLARLTGGGGGSSGAGANGSNMPPLGPQHTSVGYTRVNFNQPAASAPIVGASGLNTSSSQQYPPQLRPAPVPPTAPMHHPHQQQAAAASSRSLLQEFEGASPAVGTATAAPNNRGVKITGTAAPHGAFFANNTPNAPNQGGHFLTSADLQGTNANHQSLLMKSPRTNLTDPSGGVLIEPTAMLPARQAANQFKFTKSTFGGLQFLNNGRTALCVGADGPFGGGAPQSDRVNGWETAMCDTLLTSGRHYYEIHLDRYTTHNGHNVLIGLVFDGNYGLCDALGEDNNSLALDVGMGTKCIGGNYALPYTTANVIAEGDVIGVDVNFEKQTLEFYHNGKYLGVAFTGLCRPCYPAVSLIEQQQVTLMFPLQRPL